MADDDNSATPKKLLQMTPRAAALESRIHRLAADTGNIVWSDHFFERAEERGITTLDALRILRVGHVVGAIHPGRSPGEWKCKLVKQLKGRREAGVVVITINSGGLFVKTVEWEDWKGQ